MRLRSAAPFASPGSGAPICRKSLSAAILVAVGLVPFALQAAPQPSPKPAAPQAGRLPLADVPLPLPRPMDLGVEEEEGVEEEHPAEAATPTPSRPAAAPVQPSAPVEANVKPGELPALCAALVDQKTIIAERAPPVDQKPGCSLPVPVSLKGVRLADGNVAALNPPAILRCEAAAAVASWMREDMGPAVAALGTRIETIRVADSYDCRPRNRVKGAKISEHGMGNAFDTYGFELADKRVLTVKNAGMPVDFQNAMKASACARFSTVLGPGSDGYHEDHIHVDLAVRRLDIRLCKWTIKGPAAPVVATTTPQGQSAAAKGTVPDKAPPEGTASEDEAEEAQEAEAHGATGPIPLPPRRPASLPARTAPRG